MTFARDGQSLRIYSVQPLAMLFVTPTIGPPPFANVAPPDALTQVAIDFLTERGLLDFDYRVDALQRADMRGAGVTITPLLEGVPLYEPYLGQPRIFVISNNQGKVSMLFCERLSVERLRTSGLIPAQQAWDEFVARDLSRLMSYRLWNPYTLDRQEARREVGQPAMALPLQAAVVSRVELVYSTPDTQGVSTRRPGYSAICTPPHPSAVPARPDRKPSSPAPLT